MVVIRSPLALVPGGPVLAAPWRAATPSSARDSGTDAGAAEVVVSHTVFTHDRVRDLPAIARDAERMARVWRRSDGALWLRQWTQPTRRLLGDLTVWRREEDLRTFVASAEHRVVVTAWRARMRGPHHTWPVPTEPQADGSVDLDAVWRAALALLG
ncbi:hypothetical protein [Nocardioides sp.]|uniref:hypothetical protein n=1 Tax=Nocardioides sp. TaxID=35761 RepID=UPI00351546FE